ncbi:MAG: 4Fe-4S dicluster domain-containing protein [Motiliproteus sp.]
MGTTQTVIPIQAIDDIYSDVEQWHVNVGEEKIHPKRMPGRWRTLKWWASSVWLIYFLGPYLRWGDRQAVLIDLPNQKFHIFGLTVLPQDLWILALILLFFAIMLAVVTAIAGRVFCGFFCFQTVWTDIYVWIEERFEGPPRQRQKLDAAPWTFNKIKTKTYKHALWLLIALLTGVSFVAWFMDAGDAWRGLFSLSLPLEATITIGAFVFGTYTLAGFMREQTCLWLCPYSRIQGVMVDSDTVLPAYDVERGEPRGRLQKNAPTTFVDSFQDSIQDALRKNSLQSRSQDPSQDIALGDCIDCNLCVAVCPTGVDIRLGQQQGCITCALCIDACDTVMEKIGKPKGLIRYDSLDGLNGLKQVVWYKRARVWVYLSIMTFSVVAGAYGLSTLDALDLKVIHHRQPIYVLQSDGSIQNRYMLKILNKTDQILQAQIRVEGPNGAVFLGDQVTGADVPVTLTASGITAHEMFVRIPAADLKTDRSLLQFRVTAVDDLSLDASRAGVFMSPSK